MEELEGESQTVGDAPGSGLGLHAAAGGGLDAVADGVPAAEEAGLLADSRVMESVSLSPFDYEKNCLLYLPLHPPEQADSGYFDELAAEIAARTVLFAAGLRLCWFSLAGGRKRR